MMKKNIYLLGAVSFFTDLASQMIYPLLPQLLTGMGAGPAIIGIIEGFAEATAAFFRGIFGKWTDRSVRKKPFLFAGYGLSDMVKPLFALASGPWQVLGLRFTERMGKAIRTSARDVIIAHSARKGELGRSFGFHKAMDKLGSLSGPLLATLILALAPGNIRLVFFWAFVPALIGWLVIFWVKETDDLTAAASSGPAGEWKSLGKPFNRFLVVNAIFGLANASNAFLILKAGETGIGIGQVTLLWFVYNLTGAVTSSYIGRLSDRIPRETVILVSFLWFSLIFLFFALATEPWMIWVLFAAFGLHYALSKGVFRAFITDIVPAGQKGTAYGFFDMVEGISLLAASLLMGFIWESFGSTIAFVIHALLGFMAMILFRIYFPRK